MACKHERIKSVNCVLFCDICGEKLPEGFAPGKNTPEHEQRAETPENGVKTEAKKTRRKKV